MTQSDTTMWLLQQSEAIVRAIPPAYFQNKRWFGSKGRRIENFRLIDSAIFRNDPPALLLLVQVNYSDGHVEFYHVPLVAQDTPQPNAHAATLESPYGTLYLNDALLDDAFCRDLYGAIYAGRRIETAEGTFDFRPIEGAHAPESGEVTSVRRIATEQSNSSVVYNQRYILKFFRKLAAGLNPDVEVPLFLTTDGAFAYVPQVYGTMTYEQKNGEAVSLGVLAAFVPNEGDGYVYSLDRVRDFFKQVRYGTDPQQAAQDYTPIANQLGRITGEMHNALASNAAGQQPEFAPEVIAQADVEQWQGDIRQYTETVLAVIRSLREQYPDATRAQLDTILDHSAAFLERIGYLDVLQKAGVVKTRFHGDYHLGQVLKTRDGFVILDFEGEPARPLAQRRAKNSPLRDVVGMLRSFNYAAYSVLFEEQGRGGDPAELEAQAAVWETTAREAFLLGYTDAARQNTGAQYMPASSEAFNDVLSAYEMEKALYELNYEVNNRPDWIAIPIKGLQRIAGS